MVGDLGILHLLANSAIMSTVTVRCWWEDQTAREKTGQPPSDAEVKKFEIPLTLHSWLTLRLSIRNCSSSSSSSLGFEPDAFG